MVVNEERKQERWAKVKETKVRAKARKAKARASDLKDIVAVAADGDTKQQRAA